MTGKVRLEADRAELERFIEATFRYADEGTHAVLRTFAEGSDKVLGTVRVPLNGGLDALVDTQLPATKGGQCPAGRSVRATISTFLGSRTRERDLGNGLVLASRPTMRPRSPGETWSTCSGRRPVVASGGQWIDPQTGVVEDKLHLHWRCQEPSRSASEHALAQACPRFAPARSSVRTRPPSSLVHPLRWPGGWHRKNEPRLARIVALNPDVEIDPSEAIELLEPLIPVQRGADAADRTARLCSTSTILLR